MSLQLRILYTGTLPQSLAMILSPSLAINLTTVFIKCSKLSHIYFYPTLQMSTVFGQPLQVPKLLSHDLSTVSTSRTPPWCRCRSNRSNMASTSGCLDIGGRSRSVTKGLFEQVSRITNPETNGPFASLSPPNLHSLMKARPSPLAARVCFCSDWISNDHCCDIYVSEQ